MINYDKSENTDIYGCRSPTYINKEYISRYFALFGRYVLHGEVFVQQ